MHTIYQHLISIWQKYNPFTRSVICLSWLFNLSHLVPSKSRNLMCNSSHLGFFNETQTQTKHSCISGLRKSPMGLAVRTEAQQQFPWCLTLHISLQADQVGNCTNLIDSNKLACKHFAINSVTSLTTVTFNTFSSYHGTSCLILPYPALYRVVSPVHYSAQKPFSCSTSW